MTAPTGAKRGKITRWLRFRLTLSYVLFFAVLLAGIGIFFRGLLSSIQRNEIGAVLEQEWGGVRGYMAIKAKAGGTYATVWNYDRDDAVETLAVQRLRSILLVADSAGQVMEASEIYLSLGVESPEKIRDALNLSEPALEVRTASDGTPYMLLSGPMRDGKRLFYISVGRSMAQQQAVLNRFTLYYFALLPFILAACSLLGWFVSKRALNPVRELAAMTGDISGSNLSLRIPSRGAGDELDHLIETFNGMVGRLEKSFNQSRQFSTDVSHELRTPLTVIRGHLEVALMTAKTEEHYRDAIATALQDVERLTQTIRALLNLSQAESGQMTLQKDAIDLSAAARSAAEQFLPLAEANEVALHYETRGDCAISADRVQVERLLWNLLSNAVKYTERGGRIRVMTQRSDGMVELAVDDTGIGIPAEALPRIFERFYRVPHRADENLDHGVGLGLSFVAWIVRAHNGTIDVESEPGKGSSFRVRLPGIRTAREPDIRKEEHGVSNRRA